MVASDCLDCSNDDKYMLRSLNMLHGFSSFFWLFNSLFDILCWVQIPWMRISPWLSYFRFGCRWRVESVLLSMLASNLWIILEGYESSKYATVHLRTSRWFGLDDKTHLVWCRYICKGRYLFWVILTDNQSYST